MYLKARIKSAFNFLFSQCRIISVLVTWIQKEKLASKIQIKSIWGFSREKIGEGRKQIEVVLLKTTKWSLAYLKWSEKFYIKFSSLQSWSITAHSPSGESQSLLFFVGLMDFLCELKTVKWVEEM
jgi:hypothetical protein